MEFAGGKKRLAALAAVLCAAGCSSGGGGDGGGSSTLSVSLMDAPVDDVTAVHVEITAIWLKSASGPAQQLPLANAPVKVNLLELTHENAAVLVEDTPIPAGDYEWLAMDVNADFDGVYDSYVTTLAGGQEEVRVPSSRVRLVSGFSVAPNQAAELLFDWDMRTGLVDPPGQPGFLLKPAFRMLDVTELGALSGTIAMNTVVANGAQNGCAADDANPDVGNVVYVFAGADVQPDDVDGISADPVATIEAKPNAAGDYEYRTVLEPGDYTVAFTCQAANDDPEVDETPTAAPIVFLTPVNRTITADTVAVADF
jgi:hypothetical protein